ncbi:hypothetical protein B0H66DRAFT_529844 [Apodospora peruviana]|uniref:GATA-type domain-containing protein n=1 Tax=Apodospora peruviana TaxID=516989 RepID=A0AAE0IJ05_9PEZI|nr:hypothetical protein B0H66DRAFT_529844 [Apodospora peruviana]
MEAGESSARQSGIPSASNFDHFDSRSRSYNREVPVMATAALISPSGPYHPHHPHHHPHTSSFSSYPHSAPVASIPSMISPVDSRRTSDDSDTTHRQSLPSISEVISGSKPAAYPPQVPTSMPQTQSLPSPFASSAPSRSFGDVGSDKNPSPRTLHPTSGYPRPDALPAFSDPARPAMSTRPAPPPPLNTFPGPHLSHPSHPSPPSVKVEQLEAERQAEAAQLSAGYQHSHGQPSPAGLYNQTGRLPPGQLPLSAYPVSPRHNGPTLPSPFDSQRTPIYGGDGDYNRGNEYKSTLDRAFEVFNYGESLHSIWITQIATTSRTIFHFAEAYGAAAREQQGPQPIPSRLPTETEMTGLLDSAVLMVKKLEEVREMVLQNRIDTERARENGGRKPFDDDDSSMYGDGSLKPPYSIAEVKKRRGRAAPPGRCHSCNRIDTPEWRRGPDGARTLCNACGLHYAKLERKRQLEQRSIRPKPSDERN